MDLMLTPQQKRELLKKISDMLEKLGIGMLLVGLLQFNWLGLTIGVTSVVASLAFTWFINKNGKEK